MPAISEYAVTDLFGAASHANTLPETPSDRQAALSQYLTPGWAAVELTELALRGLGPVNVLEPSCGAGAFLSAIPSSCNALGVEIDPILAKQAAEASGRKVITSAFEDADLGDFRPDIVLGNPPFTTDFFDVLLDRSYEFLPQDGLIAMIIPTHFLQTPSRVMRWNERYAIETDLLPRTLFPGLSKTIAWSRFHKRAQRTLVGMLLFNETHQIEQMREDMRQAARKPQPWKSVIKQALQTLGGEAALSSIYDRIDPEAKIGRRFWREKVRQELGRHFQPMGNGRWALV